MIPKLGDTIRTAKPLNCGTPTQPPGTHLRVRLETPEAVEFARHLIAAGTWVVEPRTDDAETTNGE